MTVSIVSTNEPVAVPAILQDRIVHCLYFLACAGSFISFTHQLAQLGIFFTVFYEHTGNEYGFCHGSFTGTEGLEGFSGMSGETVQVQTVIPVGAADQRQIVRTFVVDDIV